MLPQLEFREFSKLKFLFCNLPFPTYQQFNYFWWSLIQLWFIDIQSLLYSSALLQAITFVVGSPSSYLDHHQYPSSSYSPTTVSVVSCALLPICPMCRLQRRMGRRFRKSFQHTDRSLLLPAQHFSRDSDWYFELQSLKSGEKIMCFPVIKHKKKITIEFN